MDKIDLEIATFLKRGKSAGTSDPLYRIGKILEAMRVDEATEHTTMTRSGADLDDRINKLESRIDQLEDKLNHLNQGPGK